MIIVDDRELRSSICEELDKLKLTYHIEHLPIADYIINNNVYIERKTVPDFLESLKDGRLFDQVKRLKRDSKHALLIIEGKRLPGRPSIRAALCSLAVQWHLPVLRSTDQSGTAWIIKQIVDQSNKYITSYHKYDFRDKRHISSLEKRILLQFRSVGPELANKLIQHFGTVYAVFSASKTQLMEVEGVGKYIADQIILIRGGN